MFETLHDVDWGALRHAYGQANDVPGLLEEFVSADEERQREIVHAWDNSLLHQGMLCEATEPAAPFLLEVAAEPTVGDVGRIEVLNFVYWIATSAWSDANGTSAVVRNREGMLIQSAVDRGRRIGQVISNGLMVFLAILDEPMQTATARVKAHAARVIGQCQERIREAIEALLLRASREREPMLAAEMAMAASELHAGARTAGATEDLNAHAVCEAAFQAAATPGSRWLAAIAACRASEGTATPDVLNELLAAPAVADEISSELRGWPSGPGSFEHGPGKICEETISALRDQTSLSPANLLEGIHRALPLIEFSQAHGVVTLLFDLLLPDLDRQPSREEPLLADEAAEHPRLVRAIEAMATHDRIYVLRMPFGESRPVGVWNLYLRDRGLPTTQEEMRELAAQLRGDA